MIKILLLSIIALTGKSADYGMIAFFNTTDCPQGWELYKPLQGKFALASSTEYPLLKTGGETTHNLTVGEIPSHSHSYLAAKTVSYYVADGHEQPVVVTNELATSSVGGSQPHNNMPPYLSLTPCQQKSASQSTKNLLERITSLEKDLLDLKKKMYLQKVN